MKGYYYADGKTNYGPFTAEDLKGKNLTRETFVWTDSFPEWKKLKDVPELRDVVGVIPPPLRDKQNSSRRWIDILLLCSLAYWLVDTLILRLFPLICSYLDIDYFQYYPYIQLISSVAFAAVPVVVAYSIQNRMLKMLAFVISGIIAMAFIVGGIAAFIQMQNYHTN